MSEAVMPSPVQPAGRDTSADPSHVTAADGVTPAQAPMPGMESTIPSVNDAPQGAPRGVKVLFVVVIVTVIAAAALLFGQKFLTDMKARLRPGSKPAAAEQADLLNPERAPIAQAGSRRPSAIGAPTSAGTVVVAPAAAASAPALQPAAAQASTLPSGEAPCDRLVPGGRLLRGSDGRVVISPQGRASCIDPAGRIVEVPPLSPEGGGPRPAAGPGATQTAAAQQPAPPKPSRYGGALFVVSANGADTPGGRAAAPTAAAAATPASAASSGRDAPDPAGRAQPTSRDARMKVQDALRVAQEITGASGASGAATAQISPAPMPVFSPGAGGTTSASPRPSGAASPTGGTQQSGGAAQTAMGGGLAATTSTPTAVASVTRNMELVLPKGRQGECVLNTRIINELPGFVSCTLVSDLFGTDGRVRLLERGSEIQGEYGITNNVQTGQRRLFVVWDRLRTPAGVQIDLRSPGTDTLGTSGLTGYLEQRWFERIGVALIVSVMSDVIKYTADRSLANSGAAGAAIAYNRQPGQGTIDAGQRIVESILKDTVNVKATLSILQGEKVAFYVSRDLDFSQAYELEHRGAAGGSASVRASGQ